MRSQANPRCLPLEPKQLSPSFGKSEPPGRALAPGSGCAVPLPTAPAFAARDAEDAVGRPRLRGGRGWARAVGLGAKELVFSTCALQRMSEDKARKCPPLRGVAGI